MSVLRRLFNGAYRRARQAEGRGDYRRAAALYVEADAPDEAANALMFHAARAETLEDRLAAWHDALRWIPDGHPRRADVEARIGLAVLDDAQRRGALGATERERLTEGAQRLERAGRWSEAATAWELLGHHDDMARCLEKAGEIERLEELLERRGERDARQRRLRRLVNDYEMAMKVGARVEARDALRQAAELVPGDRSVADLLRRLEARFPPPDRVTLSVEGQQLVLVGKLPAVLGRADADLALRGASVSRRHAELVRRGDAVVVRDMGSRNGTLVRGVPIADELELGGPTEVGLGEDVTVELMPEEDGSVGVDVRRGVDRGLRARIGDRALRLPGLAATVSFPGGHATLAADSGAELQLAGQSCAAPVSLLLDDELTVDGRHVEVRS